MTTQQKIEFYLSKGFAVEVEFKNGCKYILKFYDEDGRFLGMFGDSYIKMESWDFLTSDIKSITPIPPKPYFPVMGERMMIIETGKIGKIKTICGHAIGKGNTTYQIDNDDYLGWELAPALPEDEECEVIEVKSFDWVKFGEVTCTKPDGKKLKIKVIKK